MYLELLEYFFSSSASVYLYVYYPCRKVYLFPHGPFQCTISTKNFAYCLVYYMRHCDSFMLIATVYLLVHCSRSEFQMQLQRNTKYTIGCANLTTVVSDILKVTWVNRSNRKTLQIDLKNCNKRIWSKNAILFEATKSYVAVWTRLPPWSPSQSVSHW